MSFAYFDEPIDCPECGHLTHELYHVTSRSSDSRGYGHRVLMCEECYDDSKEGEDDWDDSWKDEGDKYEWEN